MTESEIEIKYKLLAQVAKATSLREGPEGVETLLRNVKRYEFEPIAKIARESHLPLPIAAAIRRELEKAGLLSRKRGVSLTKEGNRFVEGQLGVLPFIEVNCCYCDGQGLAVPNHETLDRFSALLEEAPSVDTTLDQAPCTAQTALKRAALMYRSGALEGKRILIIGDDDSVAIAIALFSKIQLGLRLKYSIIVVEVDDNWIEFIRRCAERENLPIEVVPHDLRGPLPSYLHGGSDVMETDPPYTLEGARLFLQRGCQGLKNQTGTQVFLSYAHRSAKDQYELIKTIVESGLAITNMYQSFNRYQGCSILGSVGQMMELSVTGSIYREEHHYNGALYTREVNPRKVRYKCLQCNTIYSLRKNNVPSTIEALKQNGCTICKGHKFKRLSAILRKQKC